MTIGEAKAIIRDLENKSALTPDEEFMLTEAYEFLIRETHDTRWMVGLGSYYYGQKKYDLALKYYEMADSYGDEWAPEGLGYIWYYGRTGEKDYEKAFKNYSKAAENGMIKSGIKVADMYKNGYYVDKDYDKYCRLIEEIYLQVGDSDYLGDPVSEVCTRLAAIRKEQGDREEALRLYEKAREFQTQRLMYDPFFGDLNIMKWMIGDIYELTDIDYENLDLYDLYHLLREPVRVAFACYGREYMVEGVAEEGGVSIKFGSEWFRSVDDFFGRALIEGERLSVMYTELVEFRVV